MDETTRHTEARQRVAGGSRLVGTGNGRWRWIWKQEKLSTLITGKQEETWKTKKKTKSKSKTDHDTYGLIKIYQCLVNFILRHSIRITLSEICKIYLGDRYFIFKTLHPSKSRLFLFSFFCFRYRARAARCFTVGVVIFFCRDTSAACLAARRYVRRLRFAPSIRADKLRQLPWWSSKTTPLRWCNNEPAPPDSV